MRPGPLDLVVRIVSMVLAGLVSLSLIGAIHTATQGGGSGGPGGFTVESAPTPPASAPEEQGRGGTGANGAGQGAGAGSGGTVAAARAPPDAAAAGSAKWLEVIAYLLFALVGIAALAALALWRGAAELRRTADAAERLAAGEGVR